MDTSLSHSLTRLEDRHGGGQDNYVLDGFVEVNYNIKKCREFTTMPTSDDSPHQNGDTSSPIDDKERAKNAEVTPSAEDLDISEAVDDLQKQLGGYGRYQMLLFVLIGIVYMRGGWQIWVSGFQALDIDHHCSASPGVSLNESVKGQCNNGTCTWEKCNQYVNKSISNDTEACHNGWTFLWDSPYTSIVSEYDLVCSNSYLKDLISTIYMVGSACSVLFLSPLADILGAKKVMLGCLWVQAVIGTCIIWSGNIIVFCILKFIIGITNMTVALCAYVLMVEIFDTAHREIPTIAMQFFWALGIMTTALFGYLIPKWEHLQLAVILPINVLSLAYIFIVPEPLPWLLSKGRVKKAENVIKRFIWVNKLPSIPDLQSKLSVFKLEKHGKSLENKQNNQNPDISDKTTIDTKVNEDKLAAELKKSEESNEENATAPVYNLLSLFKTRKMRINSLLMFYIFMINSLAYYGIMFSTPDLNGDRFLNLFLLGVVEIPAYILSLVSNKIIGRRRSISIFLFVCAVSNLTVIFIPDESDDGTDLSKLKTTLVIIGKFGITGSYSTIYLYASEVFPTVIRNQALGASSFFENLGSIAAPNLVFASKSLSYLPLAIFGGLTILGCGLVLLLPETHNQPLPQTIEDVENGYGIKTKKVDITEPGA